MLLERKVEWEVLGIGRRVGRYGYAHKEFERLA